MEGQLIQRGPNTWLIRIYTGRDDTGKRLFHNETFHGSRREAQRQRVKLVRARDIRELVRSSPQTLKAYLTDWLDTSAKARVRRVTLTSYRNILTTYVFPTLGGLRLDRLTSADVDGLYRKLQDEDELSPRTVRYVHTVLRAALDRAVRRKLLAFNPLREERVELPRRVKREMRALSPEEAKRFLAAAEGDSWAALWTLLVTSGLRPGEAMGLRWTDLDGTRLGVQRALSWGAGRTWELTEPKTGSAVRIVVLLPQAVDALRQHRKQQAEHQLRAGALWEDRGLIFCNAIGAPVDIQSLRSRFRRILTAAKLPHISFYCLRHTAATLRLAGGVHPKVVAEMLGHADITLTLNTYSHVLEGMQEESTATMARLLA
jgi:integrase